VTNEGVGVPLFASFAKGGTMQPVVPILALLNPTARAASFPPLQRTQGRCTLIGVAHARLEALATGPQECPLLSLSVFLEIVEGECVNK
jgi:hypothetical protein